MTLPLELVLVRHGQSEGNLAKRFSEAGEHGAFDRVFNGRHTRSFRLTDKGRAQAIGAGAWIRSEFGRFDRYFVSEYVRAIETAGLLGISDATWGRNFYLSERDWGELDRCSEEERARRFGDDLRMRDVEPFYWRPQNGESLAQMCLRLDRVLSTLHRECSDKRVILVCHGEVMWGFRVLLERMSQQRFKELHLSTDPMDRLHNCQIFHYARRNPETGELAAHANWMRTIRPADDPVWISPWQTIDRKRYTNVELLKLAKEYPAVLQ